MANDPCNGQRIPPSTRCLVTDDFGNLVECPPRSHTDDFGNEVADGWVAMRSEGLNAALPFSEKE